MKIAVELTLTPVQDDYEPIVVDFIKKIRQSGFAVKENPLSTQIYGDYDQVMDFLKEEIQIAMDAMDRGLLNMKIVKSDRYDHARF